MLPVLSHIEEFQGLNIWITTDGICGVGFRISPCDIETQDADDFSRRLVQVLRQIDSRILGRIKMEPLHCDNLESQYPRANAINSLGFKRTNVFLYLDFAGGFQAFTEIKNTLFRREHHGDPGQFKALLQAKTLFEQYGFRLEPLSGEEASSLFDRSHSSWVRSERTVEAGTKSIGVIRILKQPLEAFSEEDWVHVLDKIKAPANINVSFRKIDEARAKLLLERKLKQTKSGKDISSQLQGLSTEDLIIKNFQSGTQFFEMEILIVVERLSQSELSLALSEAISDISIFSDAIIETFGVAQSLIATMPGAGQHVSLIESDQALANFLPIWLKGEVTSEQIVRERALSLCRQDSTLYHFDLFNTSFNVFNTLIVGTSGKGKSVLTGLLASSLLNDPHIKVIKLDVGGSHSKECELFSGEEFQLSLDRPSGINPFQVLEIDTASDNDKLGILSKFLASLIQEQGEVTLSKALRADVENSVREYIDSGPREPNLDSFYKFATGFPRRSLLKRWVKGGVFESAFAVSDKTDLNFNEEARLRYYNFSQIFQAADPEFAQAGIASVLAQFNIEMLRSNGKRLVLICDETPFFIKSCFDFFKFSTANVRKYGHAVVLISQLSTDFVVGGDTGIIENSPQRFIFSNDGDEIQFKERFGLRERDIKEIKSLRSIVGSFSEVLLQTGDVTRKLKVKVTPEEYWRLTTSRIDKEKLVDLMKAVPGLSLREAVACLAAI